MSTQVDPDPTTLQELDTPLEALPASFKQRLERYTDVKKQVKLLEAQVKALRDEAGRLESKLLEDFIEHGASNMRVNGMSIYLHKQLWAKAPDIDALSAALDEQDRATLIKTSASTQTLSAWCRERRELELPIPECIELNESTVVRARGA